MDHFKHVRDYTKAKLLQLNRRMEKAKMITNHVVVCSVYRLRYELQQENENNLQKHMFLQNVDKKVLIEF